MKKLTAMLLSSAMLLSLTACGGGTGTETPKTSTNESVTEQTAAKVPSGLYMLKYITDETGEYVPEGNEFEDFFGHPTTLLKTMYADNQTIWCEVREDGTAVFHDPVNGEKPMDFNTDEADTVLFDGSPAAFRYDASTGTFCFNEQEGSRWWDMMEPCSQAKLDLVFAGKGGSVPVSEGKVGDMVCLGQYIQDENNETLMPIYWRVIDEQDGRILLLSDRLLDSFSYNYNPEHAVLTDVTWENSSLRAFLNDDEAGFLTMFTEDERALMVETHHENKAANEELMVHWGSFEDQGEAKYSDLAVQNRADDPDTDEKVFLLSYQEVLKYFGEATEDYDGESGYPFDSMKINHGWRTYVTDAVRTGYYDNATRAGAWMTRTLCNSHTEEDMVVYITSDGSVFDYFTYVPLFIRPAVWVTK